MYVEDRLSSVPVPAQYIGAGQEPLNSRVWDAEDGPIAEQDPTQGHMYQQWRAYIKDCAVWLEADNMPPKKIMESPGNTITDISICFNQNADLNYAYVDAGVAKLHWYDTVTASFQTLTLPPGTRTPKCTLDDKRPTQSGRSDIILAYIKSDNKFYMRRQRDRFEIEYLQDEGPFISIERMYMNSVWRLQWMMVKGAV